MPGFVEGIYVARNAGAPVERVGEVAAIEGCGLAGDRYCEGTGHWSRFGRVCQVTLIAAEDLDAVEKETGLRVRDGEHRRNVVLRGVNLEDLRRRRFRIGGAPPPVVGAPARRPYAPRLIPPGVPPAPPGAGGRCARGNANRPVPGGAGG